MAYRKPNVKGTRLRKKSTSVIRNVELREFLKQYPEHKGLTQKEFMRIVRQFNNNMIDKVIQEKNGLKLPEFIGNLIIMAFPKPKRKYVDFGESNKQGSVVYHRNWDTDERMGKIVFYNQDYSIRYSFLWGFKPCRTFKRRVSETFKSMWPRYIFMDNKKTSINAVLKG